MLVAIPGDGASERMSPRRCNSRGLVSAAVQMIEAFASADERYVSDCVWERVVLRGCPFHPNGGCGVERLGSYPRVHPAGARIARFWCRLAGASISVLPAFLASRFRSTLDEIEAVVVAVESGATVEQTADNARPAEDEHAVTLPSAVRWVRRRLHAVRAALLALLTLMPDTFEGCTPTLHAMGQRLGARRVLVTLRSVASAHLGAIGPPLGLRARGGR